MVLFWILTVRFLISKRPMRQEPRLSAEAQACRPGTWELEAVDCFAQGVCTAWFAQGVPGCKDYTVRSQKNKNKTKPRPKHKSKTNQVLVRADTPRHAHVKDTETYTVNNTSMTGPVSLGSAKFPYTCLRGCVTF